MLRSSRFLTCIQWACSLTWARAHRGARACGAGVVLHHRAHVHAPLLALRRRQAALLLHALPRRRLSPLPRRSGEPGHLKAMQAGVSDGEAGCCTTARACSEYTCHNPLHCWAGTPSQPMGRHGGRGGGGPGTLRAPRCQKVRSDGSRQHTRRRCLVSGSCRRGVLRREHTPRGTMHHTVADTNSKKSYGS